MSSDNVRLRSQDSNYRTKFLRIRKQRRRLDQRQTNQKEVTIQHNELFALNECDDENDYYYYYDWNNENNNNNNNNNNESSSSSTATPAASSSFLLQTVVLAALTTKNNNNNNNINNNNQKSNDEKRIINEEEDILSGNTSSSSSSSYSIPTTPSQSLSMSIHHHDEDYSYWNNDNDDHDHDHDKDDHNNNIIVKKQSSSISSSSSFVDDDDATAESSSFTTTVVPTITTTTTTRMFTATTTIATSFNDDDDNSKVTKRKYRFQYSNRKSSVFGPKNYVSFILSCCTTSSDSSSDSSSTTSDDEQRPSQSRQQKQNNNDNKTYLILYYQNNRDIDDNDVSDVVVIPILSTTSSSGGQLESEPNNDDDDDNNNINFQQLEEKVVLVEADSWKDCDIITNELNNNNNNNNNKQCTTPMIVQNENDINIEDNEFTIQQPSPPPVCIVNSVAETIVKINNSNNKKQTMNQASNNDNNNIQSTKNSNTTFAIVSSFRPILDKLQISYGQPIHTNEIFTSWFLSSSASSEAAPMLSKQQQQQQQQQQEQQQQQQQQYPTKNQNAKDIVVTNNDTDNDQYCLICFDRICDNTASSIFYLKPCNHVICTDCWIAYLESNAKSGYGATIRCPGEKCTVSINLFDAAHILFSSSSSSSSSSNNNDDNNDNNIASSYSIKSKQDTFDRLLYNELEQYCTNKMKGRYCPSPGCNLLLAPSQYDNTEIHGPGWNLLYCTCGTIVCADCTTGTIAHPGMTCAKYKILHDNIAAGRADDEFHSQKWILQNSRPCPQCKFPIQRIDGCNHVMCTKCKYYFCWQCGGPGNECMSFFCENTHRFYDDNPTDQNEVFGQYNSKVYAYKQYRASETRFRNLETMTRRLLSSSSSPPPQQQQQQQQQNVNTISVAPTELDYLLLEKLIQLSLVWSYAYFYNESTEEVDLLGKLNVALDRMQWIALAYDVRKFLRNQSSLSSNHHIEAKDSFSLEEVTRAMAIQMQKKKKIMIGKSDEVFDCMMQELECKELCLMDDIQFEETVQVTIKACLSCILKKPKEVSKNKRKKKKMKSKIVQNQVDEEDDRWIKKSAKHPWQVGYRLENKEEIAENRLNKNFLRWKKGKRRVIIRREHALCGMNHFEDEL